VVRGGFERPNDVVDVREIARLFAVAGSNWSRSVAAAIVRTLASYWAYCS
jgi:hypothetical protein